MTDEARRRAEECKNNWSDGTCPQCGESHYEVVRRGAIADAVAQAVKEKYEWEIEATRLRLVEREQAAEIAWLTKERDEQKERADLYYEDSMVMMEQRDAARVAAVRAEQERHSSGLANGHSWCPTCAEALRRVGGES